MDLPDRWRRLLARYWWIALVVAIVVALANIGSALAFIGDDLLPMVLTMASALGVGEWAALASMALSLALLAAKLWSVRRLVALRATPGSLRLLEPNKDQAERYRRLYEEEEQRFWTSSGLTREERRLPPRRMNECYGLEVSVGARSPWKALSIYGSGSALT